MKKTTILFLVAIIFIIASNHLYQNKETEFDEKEEIANFQESFIVLEKQAKTFAEKTIELLQYHGEDYIDQREFLEFVNKNDNKIAGLFITIDDYLIFWSNNNIPLTIDDLQKDIKGLDYINNGYYYYFQKQHNSHTLYFYILIKQNYKYQNRFLVNDFNKAFSVKQEYFLSSNPALGYPVYEESGDYAFSIKPIETIEHTTNKFLYLLSLILAILSLVIIFNIAWRVSKHKFKNTNNKIVNFLLAFGVLAGFRAILSFFNIPSIFYNSKLFSPSIYASNIILSSLGELLLHVGFLGFLLYILFIRIKNISFYPLKNVAIKISTATIAFGLIFTFNFIVIYVVNTLVFNSQLMLNVNFINEINIYNITGLIVVGLLFLSSYFVSFISLKIALETNAKLKALITNYIAVLAAFIVLWKLVFPFINYYWIILSVIPLVLLAYNRNTGLKVSNKFSNIVISLFIFCLAITIAMSSFYKEKEIQKTKSLALTLSIEQDPIAEYLFSEIEENLHNDWEIMNYLARDPYDTKSIKNYLRNKYFFDYWTKYDLQITVCSPYENLIIRPSNIEVNCLEFFNDYIEEFGKETEAETLIFLDNKTGRSSYIAKIPVELIFASYWQENKYYIFLELDSKFIPKDIGFPELLIDKEAELPHYLNVYSYAVYKDGVLINKFGKFFYSMNVNTYGEFTEDFTFFSFDDYNHLFYNKDDETVLIVSKQKESLLEKIAPFSYLFVLYFIILLIYWILNKSPIEIFSLRMNFKSRLQASMIIIVLLSLILVVSVSAWFIYNIYTNKNKEVINEKAYSIAQEMEHQLIEAPIFDYEYRYYLNDVLLKLSNVFFTDINAYSPEGELIGSSRSRVFEEGLISKLMDPYAYYHLKGQKKILYVHKEKIGELEYLSAYIPVIDPGNDIIAYINMPYFAKHGELRSEISYFLVAFINIYLLLVVLAIVIAFFISNYVTRPLQLIRDNISSVKLGDLNKKINWKRNDEIGQLVQEYNRMIDELQTSADLLAQSERESAWREMAKQVAHEIKNPLTPMKLSVQYLEKAWKDKVPDWDERLNKFVVSMVEQINNLSEIASAFSDFAKMPAGKFEKIELYSFIKESLGLYKDFDKTKINILNNTSKQMWVYIDKKQMIRVFNNLIRNAVQAYDKDKVAVIDIILYEEQNYYCVEVRDYGHGIREEFKKNIFQPYFTTKTGGLGLGLAMVKNIINGFGGVAAFESKEGEGSSFYLKLPKKYSGKE